MENNFVNETVMKYIGLAFSEYLNIPNSWQKNCRTNSRTGPMDTVEKSAHVFVLSKTFLQKKYILFIQTVKIL